MRSSYVMFIFWFTVSGVCRPRSNLSRSFRTDTVVEKRRRVRTVFYYVAARDVEIVARFEEKTARMSADLFPLAVISGARMFQVYVS